MIVFIKHIDIEGPETLGDFFQAKGYDVKIIELQNGDALPENLDDIQAVVSLGGPMNVYEEEKHPFLRDENAFMQKVLAGQVPFMGLCLGSQILAKACGARVGKSPGKEIGFFPVELTRDGDHDPLFEGVDRHIEVFQWHEDMSELPTEAHLLASSPNCPHQAFRVGYNAYGLQFHIEITKQAIQSWADRYFSSDSAELMEHKRLMMEDYHAQKELFHEIRDRVYNNFLKMVIVHGKLKEAL